MIDGNDAPMAFGLLWEELLERDIDSLGGAYAAIRAAFGTSDESSEFDDILVVRKVRAEGLLLEALCLKHAVGAGVPYQLIDVDWATTDDEVGLDGCDSATLISALAARWCRARGATTPAEWAVILRSEIHQLLDQIQASSVDDLAE